MNYDDIFSETSAFMKEHWWDVFFMRLLFGVLTFIIATVLVSYVFDPRWFSNLKYISDIDKEDIETFFISAAASSAISSILVGTINAALTLNIIEAYQTKGTINFKSVYHIIKKMYLKIVTVLVILGIVQFIITLTPYVNRLSFIILPLINYFTIFTYFIMYDHKELNGFQSTLESVKMSKGHKFHLFKITVHYYLRKFVGYLIMALGFLFIIIAVILNEGTIMSSLFMMIGLAKIGLGISVNIFMAIKFGPYATVAHAVYYEKIKRA